MGSAINNAGINLRWLRDNIFNISYDEMVKEALNADTHVKSVFLPYITGEVQRDWQHSFCVYFGLKNNHTKGHLIKAGLEGVAYSLMMLFESVKD